MLTGTGCQNCTWHEIPQRDPVAVSQVGLLNRLPIDLHFAGRLQEVTFGIALNGRMMPRDIRDQGDIDRRFNLGLP